MIELLVHEYRSALLDRTAVDSIGRLIGVILAVWELKRRALKRQIYGLETLLGRMTLFWRYITLGAIAAAVA